MAKGDLREELLTIVNEDQYSGGYDQIKDWIDGLENKVSSIQSELETTGSHSEVGDAVERALGEVKELADSLY
jgi:hypothetical protein